MRQTIKGLVAAFAVMTAGSAPAMACGFGGCCGAVDPCATSYAAPVYSYAPTYGYSYGGGCGGCGTGGWGYERLAEPTTQYYYVNQGPTYSGPGAFAPAPAYEEAAIPAYTGYGYGYGYHHYRPYHHSYHYGYGGYAPRHYGYRYGYMPHHYGYASHAYRHWGNEGYYGGRPLVRRYY
jgi:hypothetical protein